MPSNLQKRDWCMYLNFFKSKCREQIAAGEGTDYLCLWLRVVFELDARKLYRIKRRISALTGNSSACSTMSSVTDFSASASTAASASASGAFISAPVAQDMSAFTPYEMFEIEEEIRLLYKRKLAIFIYEHIYLEAKAAPSQAHVEVDNDTIKKFALSTCWEVCALELHACKSMRAKKKNGDNEHRPHCSTEDCYSNSK